MSTSALFSLVARFFIVFLLAGIIFFKVRIGKRNRDDESFHAARRNSIVAAVVVFAFLIYWFNTFISGRLIEEGIVVWKIYAAGFAVLAGIASIDSLWTERRCFT